MSADLADLAGFLGHLIHEFGDPVAMVGGRVHVDLGRLDRGLAQAMFQFSRGGFGLGREGYPCVPKIVRRTFGRPLRFRAR